jgi:hypothetical protein
MTNSCAPLRPISCCKRPLDLFIGREREAKLGHLRLHLPRTFSALVEIKDSDEDERTKRRFKRTMDEFGKAFAAWGDSIEAGTMAVCERAGTPMHECSAAAYGAVWGLYVRTGEPAEKRLPLFKRFNELFPRSEAASNDAVMCATDQWHAEQRRVHGLTEDDPLSRLCRPL